MKESDLDRYALAMLIKPPTDFEIRGAVEDFLFLSVKIALAQYLSPPKAHKMFSLSWEDTFPPASRKFGLLSSIDLTTALPEGIKYCQQTCIYYMQCLPIKDKEGFLSFCFHHKQFTLRKFAICVDSSFLAPALVDNDQSLREFAQLYVKYTHVLI